MKFRNKTQHESMMWFGVVHALCETASKCICEVWKQLWHYTCWKK